VSLKKLLACIEKGLKICILEKENYDDRYGGMGKQEKMKKNDKPGK